MKLAHGRFLVMSLLGLALSSVVALATPQSTPVVAQTMARGSSARLMVYAGTTGAQAGFTVDWMTKAEFDAAGGWPAAGDSRIKTGDFFGVPVWIVQGSSGDFTIPPVMWQAIQLGELFDESGLVASDTDELTSGTEYVIRVKAKASGGFTESAPTADVNVTTSSQVQNCTFTQGYWKTHPTAWPAGNVTLGNVSYTQAQLLAIFNQPAGGNGLLILAHQLIAAKLNIANGADGSSVASTIAAADALIGNLVVPPGGSGFLSPSSVNSLATTLDNFNNGVLGPGHCGTVAATPATWGQLKATYRR